MDLDELTTGELRNGAALVTVLQGRTVPTLQTKADPLGDDERQDRTHDQGDPEDPRGRKQADLERVRQDVVRTSQPEHTVEGDAGGAQAGADRDVARPVGDVVRPLVPGDPRLQERVDRQTAEEQAHEAEARDQHAGHDRVPADVEVEPVGEQAERPLQEAHVPVRLETRGNGRRSERAEQVDRVDLNERAQTRDGREREEEEPACLEREAWEHRRTDDLLLGPARSWVLGVLLVPQDDEVRCDQRQQDARQQQDVQHVQARNDRLAGELTAEHEERQVSPDHRDREQHTLEDADTHAGR